MAQRRMFSKQIVQTDAFLDMPQTSQLLYFHLAMEGDDDGFVSSPKKIMKIVGASDDNYRILIAKRFIIPFESGVCVIKHWRIHNYIQNDRYQETKYIEEKSTLQLKDNLAYTECIQDVSIMDSQDRIGKVRLGEESIDTKVTFGENKKVKLSNEDLQKLFRDIGETMTYRLIDELDDYIASTGKRYHSHYATIRNWARRKAQDIIRDNKPKRKIV